MHSDWPHQRSMHLCPCGLKQYLTVMTVYPLFSSLANSVTPSLLAFHLRIQYLASKDTPEYELCLSESVNIPRWQLVGIVFAWNLMRYSLGQALCPAGFQLPCHYSWNLERGAAFSTGLGYPLREFRCCESLSMCSGESLWDVAFCWRKNH